MFNLATSLLLFHPLRCAKKEDMKVQELGSCCGSHLPLRSPQTAQAGATFYSMNITSISSFLTYHLFLRQNICTLARSLAKASPPTICNIMARYNLRGKGKAAVKPVGIPVIEPTRIWTIEDKYDALLEYVQYKKLKLVLKDPNRKFVMPSQVSLIRSSVRHSLTAC